MSAPDDVASGSDVYILDKDRGWLAASLKSLTASEAVVKISSVPASLADAATFADTTDPVQVSSPSDFPGEERTVRLSDYAGGTLPLRNCDAEGNLVSVADMGDLAFLHEPAILYNLKARHAETIPYTRTGDIVIAVNPFKWIEGLYSESTKRAYGDHYIWNRDNNVDESTRRSALSPHVYETSSMAYSGLAIHGMDQSILVSGESGAGKTETVKIVMSYLATVQSDASDDGMPSSSAVVAKVLDSNPLLEAFGNAKTVRNDNSSRFGKYIQLEFDAENANDAAFAGRSIPSCVLAGSQCETYLLEKSRVVGHEKEERTYHIFYQLLAAPESFKKKLWNGFETKDMTNFKYVGHTDTSRIEGKSDAERFHATIQALSLLGISDSSIDTLFEAIATVLQLGNLVFAPDPNNEEGSVLTSTDQLQALSAIMGVTADDIAAVLTYRTVSARGESFRVPLRDFEARDGVDAFAKEIYQNVFDWVVKKINEGTCAEHNYDGGNNDPDSFGTIGLLDIFGFESFKVNRFEQLCINYANEKLQAKYTVDIFKSVQEEYEFEGIDLCAIEFGDNTSVLKLIEGRMGLIAVLNEECVRPKGNDSSFVSKVYTLNKDSDILIANKMYRPYEFAIHHYAGPVKYNATLFVSKNTDVVPPDLLECAGRCTNSLIREELVFAARAKLASAPKGRGKSKSGATVWTKFRSQLTSLMATISETKTRYIRCIKPNRAKQPRIMDHRSAVEQLRCAGVIAAVTISRVAFPNKLTHGGAVERFWCLADTPFDADADAGPQVEALLDRRLRHMEKETDGAKPYVMGKTRVYFRAGAMEHLEAKRLLALGVVATVMQRYIRKFVERHKYRRLRLSSIVAQAKFRNFVARRTYLSQQKNALLLQCWMRVVLACKGLLFLKRETSAVRVQSSFRKFYALHNYTRWKASCILLQSMTRGMLQRPKYKAMQAEAAEEAKIENQLKTLQKKLAQAEARIRAAEKGEAPVKYDDEDKDEKKIDDATQQQNLIHESEQMLKYLRDEVFKAKGKNFLLRADYNEMREANAKLSESLASAVASFGAQKQYAQQLNNSNKKLVLKLTAERSLISHLTIKLKENDTEHDKAMQKLQEELDKARAQNKILEEQAKQDKQKAKIVSSPMAMSHEPSVASFTHKTKEDQTPRASFDDEMSWGHDLYFTQMNRGEGTGRRRRRRRRRRKGPENGPQDPPEDPAKKNDRNMDRGNERGDRQERNQQNSQKVPAPPKKDAGGFGAFGGFSGFDPAPVRRHSSQTSHAKQSSKQASSSPTNTSSGSRKNSSPAGSRRTRERQRKPNNKNVVQDGPALKKVDAPVATSSLGAAVKAASKSAQK